LGAFGLFAEVERERSQKEELRSEKEELRPVCQCPQWVRWQQQQHIFHHAPSIFLNDRCLISAEGERISSCSIAEDLSSCSGLAKSG
jgi:hypothetical protein